MLAARAVGITDLRIDTAASCVPVLTGPLLRLVWPLERPLELDVVASSAPIVNALYGVCGTGLLRYRLPKHRVNRHVARGTV